MWSVHSNQHKTRHAGRGKDALLRATTKVITRRGLDQARFADIAAETGVAISSLQYFFGAREDLLLAAVEYAVAGELRALEEIAALPLLPYERLQRLIAAAIGDADTFAESRLFWNEVRNAALRNPEFRPPYSRMYQTWLEVLKSTVEAGIRDGVFAENVDPQSVALQIIAVIDGLTTPLLIEHPAVDGERAEQLAGHVVEAILVTKPRLTQIA